MSVRCVNCGRRIPEDTPERLCPKCAACHNLYEAKVRRIRGGVVRAMQSAVIAALIGLVLRLFDARLCKIAGMVLLYYALVSFLLSAAGQLSAYIQLRCALKKELAEKET